ncbi:protein TALPID3 isoform X2 [Brienomyrus brachyistius]|uniref:protein TALPID3 isoform X2 n=1 Tax=Brienomyrus brachyistius TaxID=42636 RepID=UPI0020B1995B|nr:protein TALPID3 isoform X2 [Brienomyrus brachyistius]
MADISAAWLHRGNPEESSTSSDAEDIIIRSTRTQPANQSCGKRDVSLVSSGWCPKDKMRISVQKLRGAPSSSRFTEPSVQQADVPPVLAASKLLSSPWVTGNRGSLHGNVAVNPQLPDQDPWAHQAPNKKKIKAVKYNWPPGGSAPKGEDMVISQFAPGGKEAVRAALKQRSQSAPLRREVKVRLLEQEVTPFSEGQLSDGSPREHVTEGAASLAAAVTAAALAATAPLIKAQSDVEARVSQVSEGLQKLREAERPRNKSQGSEAGSPLTRMSRLEEQLGAFTQQRLQHLERIQAQQLELQNRLLGSALDAMSARAPPPQASSATPSDADLHRLRPRRSPSPPRCLVPMAASRHPTAGPCGRSRSPAGNGRLLEEIASEPMSWEGRTGSTGGVDVTMGMVSGQPESSRACRLQPEPPPASFPSSSPLPSSVTLDAGAGPWTSASARLARPRPAAEKDPGRLRAGRAPAPTPTQLGSAVPMEDGEPAQTSAAGRPGFSTLPPPLHITTPREASCVFRSSSGQLPLAPQPSLLRKSQPAPSMFEEAGRVLREIRHSKKVLEENLEAVLRAKDAETLYSQLEALSGNSNATEELRIKQTVDAWISTLSRDIQTEMAKEDTVGRGGERPTSIDITAKYKGAKGPCQVAPRWAPRKPPVRDKLQGPVDRTGMRNRQSAPHTKEKLAVVEKPQAAAKPEREDEVYLMKIYGKALYEGHRRTLKNSPYLRFNSPSPKSKGPRPRVVERVKGVKVKSAKTQTSPCSGQRVFSSQPQYIFSPMQEVPDDPKGPRTPMEGFLIPMAIPLGQPRIDGEPPRPSSVIIGNRPVTVTTSIPPTSTTRRPNVAVLEVTSKKKAPPQLQVQVLQGVDIDSVSSPTPEAPPEPAASIQTAPQTAAGEEEGDVFPGTDFLAVADITQEPEAVEDLPVRIDGLPMAPGAPYHGPVFPPQAPEPPHLENPTRSTIQQETLENRLVNWVEQQLMARMVTELHPWAEPASPSQESCSSASDIVEAAGGEGLQLFVDAGVPVNSDLIRQYVNESLAEMVALFLGQRPAAPAGLVEDIPIPEEPVVQTPVPTPRDTPPPAGRTQIPLGTPEASELESLAESCREPQGVDPMNTLPSESERSPVATPKCTPVPSPPVVATPTPPPTHLSPSAGCQYTDAWGDSKLPLEEEAPPMRSEEPEGGTGVMSVAREEEPVSLISSMPPLPVEVIPLPPMQTPPLQRAAPPPIPTPSTEDSSTASSVTETELVGRHISEGELLVSCGQMVAARGLTEDRLTVPNLNASLSSSLHEVQDMDYDPPSEGQVMRRPPHIHQEPANRGPVPPQEEACPTESLWDEESSLGEVSKGQRPPVAVDVEHALRGLSLLGLAGPEMGRLSSPGQVPLPSGVDRHPISSGNPEERPTAPPSSRMVEMGDSQDENTDSDRQAYICRTTFPATQMTFSRTGKEVSRSPPPPWLAPGPRPSSWPLLDRKRLWPASAPSRGTPIPLGTISSNSQPSNPLS